MKDNEFFLETDAFTNENVAAFLASEGIAAESTAQFKDVKGNRRHVWQVPYRIITVLNNAERAFPFRYRVFVRAGHGRIRPFTLHKKRRKSVHSKRIAEKVRQIKEKKEGARNEKK